MRAAVSSLRPPVAPVAILAVLLPCLSVPATAGRAGGSPVQVVHPGRSIQEAIDHAPPGGWIIVTPGVYRETADATNGLIITRPLHLVGISTPGRKVVLENAGGQSNGIVAVPEDRRDCMHCHASLAPPFELLPGVDSDKRSHAPPIHGLSVSGITIRNFDNNGFFAENLDGFSIVDVHSVDNPNYGIFPTLSSHGLIADSSASGADDSGIWVETSHDVRVTNSLAEGNVNGFEVSNSEDIVLEHNEARGNSIGMSILFLPDVFDERPDTRRITVRDNHVHDNNKPNTAEPGSILSTVPSGIGILYLGADDSSIERNRVRNNPLAGIGIADYCLPFSGGPYDCTLDPEVSPGFLADQGASGNRVVDNTLVANGTNPDPGPFAFAASDLALLTLDDEGNCFQGNAYSTWFSLLGSLPACP